MSEIRAITIEPGRGGSARLETIAAPAGEGAVLVSGLAMGVCGTDAELVRGNYGWAPPDRARLVLGHESLGQVLEAPPGSDLRPGDHVVGVVRRPDPVPCTCCAQGRADLCRNGRYTERGIKERDGFGAQQWRIEPEHTVKVDPALGHCAVLTEPASVVAKAWERTDQVGAAACVAPRTALITGAGPVGMLAALLAVQRGLQTTVVDIVEGGPKPGLVHDLGAAYHRGSAADLPDRFDVVIEATGLGRVVLDAVGAAGVDGVVCLTGLSPAGRELNVDLADVNRAAVLGNQVIVGSVNATRAHYEQGAAALAAADRRWVERLITRRVPLEQWEDALQRRPDDVKVVIDLTG